ncbi:MAG: HAD family hydrolase [Gemmatimonadales bacterium]
MIKIVALDADDTLWHNEPLFTQTKNRFRDFLSGYHDPEWVEERLYDTEIKNLRHFGYGIKSFALSMIETAIELTEGRISGGEVQEIMNFAKEMLAAPVCLLDGVEETVAQLAREHYVMLVTKGDLFDQESKLARSGLGDLFSDVEVVTEKTCSTYQTIATRKNVKPHEFVMVGDSLKSDILPVLDAGAHAIHVPYSTVWEHEAVSEEVLAGYDFPRARDIWDVPRIVEDLNN